MDLYKLKKNKLEQVDISYFNLEKDIQEIVENNSEELFQLEFVSSEFSAQNFRLDSVCFDNETNSFVIIEYKKSKKFSVIDQGFTYLVQVQESSGTTVSFSWLTGNYTAAVQVMTAALSWTPTNYGSHIVTIYVKDTDTFPFEILSGYVLPTTVPIDELGDDLAIPATFEIIVTNESGELVQKETSIPSWIKNTAGWWADGSINDTSFLEGISYLIQNDIIVVSSTEAGTGTEGAVPEWVKNTAGWWAADQIDDDVFVNAIQYLIKEGLIQV